MATHPLFRVRYWRTYPWPMQLLLLLLLVFTLGWLFVAISYVVVPALTGYSIEQTKGVSKDSPRGLIDAALLSQALISAGIFLIPSLLFAYLSHSRPRQYLGLRLPGKAIHWPLVIGCILGAAPLFLGLDTMMRQLLPQSSSDAQQANDRITMAFLQTNTIGELLLSLLVVGVLPALGEEAFFRGVLYRFVAKRIPNRWFPIAASAIFFALVHYNPSGMAAIFLAGILFALFYSLTGSLLPGMLAHFVYNGSQVVLVYLAQHRSGMRAVLESSSVPPIYLLSGSVLLGLSFWALWRARTPLPPDWASDAEDTTPVAAVPED